MLTRCATLGFGVFEELPSRANFSLFRVSHALSDASPAHLRKRRYPEAVDTVERCRRACVFSECRASGRLGWVQDTRGQFRRSHGYTRQVKLCQFLLSLSVCLAASAAESPQLWYKTPAADWGQALPIGNGRLAGMVYGGAVDEQIQLNEESIFAGKAMDRVNPGARENIPVIRRLLLEGKVKEAEELAEKNMLAIPRRQPPYEPLGDLRLHFDGVNAAPVQDYRRSLDLYDGIATVGFEANGVRYTREVFASYPDHAIVMHLQASQAGALHFRVSFTRAMDGTIRHSMRPRRTR